jgi:hypothetical protein
LLIPITESECEYSKQLLKKKLFYLVFLTCPENRDFPSIPFKYSGVQDRAISDKKGVYPLFFRKFSSIF